MPLFSDTDVDGSAFRNGVDGGVCGNSIKFWIQVKRSVIPWNKRGVWKPKMRKVRFWYLITMRISIPLWSVWEAQSKSSREPAQPRSNASTVRKMTAAEAQSLPGIICFLALLYTRHLFNFIFFQPISIFLIQMKIVRKNIIMGLEPQLCILCWRLP